VGPDAQPTGPTVPPVYGRGVSGGARYSALVVSAALVIAASSTGCASTGSARRGGAAGTSAPPVPCGTKRTFSYASRPGVDPNLTSLDVYTPAAGEGGCADRPLVVWVHGGGWTSGDKSEYMHDKVALFNGAGYVFASINYELTDRKVNPPAPQYPVHDQDAADAVAWLVHHAAEVGADPARIAVLGHSAGGGIVGAISTDERYLGKDGLTLSTLRCAASLDGEGLDVTASATTSPPEVQAGYRDVFTADRAVWDQASPIRHVAPGKGIPAFFMAVRGDPWRLATQTAFVEALRKADVPVTVLDSAALEHLDLTTEVGAPGDTLLTPPLMQFLGGCFTSPAK
jgi:acetyl esterase/lipase